MNQLILASHSKLAAGMRETVQFFGCPLPIAVLEQTEADTDFPERAEALLQQHQGKTCIVFTDLYGGSVNQAFFRLLPSYSFFLITGMNLAVILECAFAAADIDEAFLRQAVETSRSQCCIMNDMMNADPDED